MLYVYRWILPFRHLIVCLGLKYHKKLFPNTLLMIWMALTSFACNLDCCIQTSIHITHICSKAAGRHTSRHLLLKAWSLKHQQIWLVKYGMLLEEDQKLLTMRSMNWRLSTRVCDVLKSGWQTLVNWYDWIMIVIRSEWIGTIECWLSVLIKTYFFKFNLKQMCQDRF